MNVRRNIGKKKREVVLMSYFLEMMDTEIAKYRDVVRFTVRYHKLTLLQILRKIMEDIEDEKKNKNLLPFHIIVAATAGEREAVKAVLIMTNKVN